jgi:hypothetical protein
LGVGIAINCPMHRPEQNRISERVEKQTEFVISWVGKRVLTLSGVKPKGMHWKTFHELQLKHDVLVNQSLARIVTRLRLFEDESLIGSSAKSVSQNRGKVA